MSARQHRCLRGLNGCRHTTIALAVFLASCAPLHSIDANNAPALLEDFTNGRILLKSNPTRFGTFIQQREDMHRLYASGDWVGLSKAVIQVDFGVDLSWYYLGASAELLGFLSAAQVYYEKAFTTPIKCISIPIPDACGGLSFPGDAGRASQRVSQQMTIPQRPGS